MMPPFDAHRVRRLAISIAGWTLLAVGLVLLVLPGPGLPLVVGGLALLGRSVPWARRLRERITALLRRRRPEPGRAAP